MGDCLEDVLRIVKKLEKQISKEYDNPDRVIELLNALGALPITLDAIKKSQLGKVVNYLRKSCSDGRVKTLAKSLLKNWKKLLPVDSKEGEKEEGSHRSTDNIKMSPSSSRSTKVLASSSKQASSPNSKPVRFQSAKEIPTLTNNSLRLKCRNLLVKTLKIREIPDGSLDPDNLGAVIEDHIFLLFNGLDLDYKNRVRSRVANLKDPKNPQLRFNVLQGIISAKKIACMTHDEMATDEMRDLRRRYAKESIDDHQMALTGGTQSGLLTCGKCKKKNCTYNQVQTRSADEPMTTFVFCNECGHRWKFC